MTPRGQRRRGHRRCERRSPRAVKHSLYSPSTTLGMSNSAVSAARLSSTTWPLGSSIFKLNGTGDAG